MVLVLASRWDGAVPALLQGKAGTNVAVITCAELSQIGWQLGVASPTALGAAVAGAIVPAEQITGVITRLATITERELPHIVAADRAYVAAEMRAFVLAWLQQLRCPILNRPSPVCLMGPASQPAWWIWQAAHVGLRVEPLRIQVDQQGVTLSTRPEQSCAITVVGQQTFGPGAATLHTAVQRLAAAAQVELLRVHWSSSAADALLIGADMWPDLQLPGVADAIFARIAALKTV